jgi:microcystin-dependent protein
MAINRDDWLRSVVPAGTVIAFAGTVAPTGWLLCNGSAINRSTYSALFTAIGSAHGSGDGLTTFNLPDYRGRFLRGVDSTAGNDPDKLTRTAMATGGNTGNAVGSLQSDENKPHAHFVHASDNPNNVPTNSTNTLAGGIFSIGSFRYSTSPATHSPSSNSTGAESRPKNASVNYIIKA